MSVGSPDSLLRRVLRGGRLTRGAAAVAVLFVLMAAYAEGVYWSNRLADRTPAYQTASMKNAHQPPLTPGHALGTDALGRDVFQRLLQGARIAFEVGIFTSLIALPLGVLLGCLAGYWGGWVDDLIVWFYTTVASIPGILLILAIALVAGKGMGGVCLGIGLTTWVGLCRLIRAEVLKQKRLPYVMAARSLGLGSARILFRHILPNVMHLVLITFTLRFPAAIGTEVFLSFLGVGVQGEPSWGAMIAGGRMRLWQGAWWEMTFVSLAIFFVVLAFHILGDALRDALDPAASTGGA
ncbi:MAG: ABC transporter permease [Kiritimatiellia bacterium]|nr:ABC transporter permease [Kiritimatiellia bacterium]